MAKYHPKTSYSTTTANIVCVAWCQVRVLLSAETVSYAAPNWMHIQTKIPLSKVKITVYSKSKYKEEDD